MFNQPTELDGAAAALQVAINTGAPSASVPVFLVNPNIGLKRWDLQNTAEPQAGAATLSPPIDIPIDSFDTPPTAVQPGRVPNICNNGPYNFLGYGLVPNGVSFRSKLVQQGNHVWGVHEAKAGERSGLRWYEIDLDANQVVQSGTISDPSLDLIYPSIAVNPFGDAVICFTATGKDLFPSAYAVVVDAVTGQYYEIDVTDLVREDYALDGDHALSAFRLQIRGATFFEDNVSNRYTVTTSGTGRPELLLSFVLEPSSSMLAVGVLLGLLLYGGRGRRGFV